MENRKAAEWLVSGRQVGNCRIVMFRIFVCVAMLGVMPLCAQNAGFAVIPDSPRPGEPVTVAAAGLPEGTVYASLYNGQNRRLARARFFYYMTVESVAGPSASADESGASGADNRAVPCWTAVLAVPSTAGSGAMKIRLETVSGQETAVIAEQEFAVAERRFNAEEIPLNQINTDIRTKPDPVKTTQADELWAILARTGNTVYAEGPFVPPVPVNTRRTSYFGDRRVYVYTTGNRDTSIHAGVDYGVPTGTPVRACARGKVVLARFRISTGYSVVMEHLPGVYSLYYHMDSLNVVEGSIIDAGTTLGASGATGLATGPHLHWEIRAATENTDPDAFVNRALLDRNLIFSKLGLKQD
ncbi:MAG: M23 family metallopeptidase [Spirochaetaceae bacterium]|jgi:murein DD-endopeptidase MepM/ murein hydrolase activator NlpD|nr:M23 family metallopeptidase [Spirochaetaceae bacterium]